MPTNLDRASWADNAIRTFRTETGCDHEDSLADLLADLMHWADIARFDFDLALERACGHYAAEIAEEAEARMQEAPTAASQQVYLHLLHGRFDPKAEMSGWGFTGPILGPFEAVHVTYKEHIRCIACSGDGELELGFHGDLLVHDGRYYGDFEICAGGH